jgi:hypothetical protein
VFLWSIVSSIDLLDCFFFDEFFVVFFPIDVGRFTSMAVGKKLHHLAPNIKSLALNQAKLFTNHNSFFSLLLGKLAKLASSTLISMLLLLALVVVVVNARKVMFFLSKLFFKKTSTDEGC